VGSVAGNVDGNVTGSVGSLVGHTVQTGDNYARLGAPAGASVSADVAAIKVETLSLDGTKIPDTISLANINAQAVDALATDTYAEPAQGTPAATVSLAAKINYLYKAWRNRHTQTATQYSVYNDDAVTVDHKATFSDDATTADRGEVATGP